MVRNLGKAQLGSSSVSHEASAEGEGLGGSLLRWFFSPMSSASGLLGLSLHLDSHSWSLLYGVGLLTARQSWGSCTFYVVAIFQEQVLQETEGGSCQSLPARAWKLAEGNFHHILLAQAIEWVTEPTQTQRGHRPYLSMKRMSKNLWSSLIHHMAQQPILGTSWKWRGPAHKQSLPSNTSPRYPGWTRRSQGPRASMWKHSFSKALVSVFRINPYSQTLGHSV